MSQTNINIRMDDTFDVPNAETLAAIDDVNKKNLSKSFHSIAELMEDLNAL